jgi:hypothetical protein
MDATPHASDGAKSHELTDHHEHGDHQMHAGDRMPVRAPEHRGHDVHGGHSAAMFRDKFWISLLLTLPTLTWGQMLAERALKVGDLAPPFELANQHGVLVRSGDLLARGSLVITFFPGHW